MSELKSAEILLATINGAQYGLQFGDGSLRKGRALKAEEMNLIRKALRLLSTPEPGQPAAGQSTEDLRAKLMYIYEARSRYAAVERIDKLIGDIRTSISVNTMTGEIKVDKHDQNTQAQPAEQQGPVAEHVATIHRPYDNSGFNVEWLKAKMPDGTKLYTQPQRSAEQKSQLFHVTPSEGEERENSRGDAI